MTGVWLRTAYVHSAPFAKPHLRCSPLLAQLIFAHILALPSCIRAGRFSCEHEICPQECMSELVLYIFKHFFGFFFANGFLDVCESYLYGLKTVKDNSKRFLSNLVSLLCDTNSTLSSSE